MVNLETEKSIHRQKTIDYRVVRKVVQSLDMLVLYWLHCCGQILHAQLFSRKSLYLFPGVFESELMNVSPEELQELKDSCLEGKNELVYDYINHCEQMRLNHLCSLNVTPPNKCNFHGEEFLNTFALLKFLLSKAIGASIMLFQVKVELIMIGEFLPLLFNRYPFLKRFYNKNKGNQ